jgi:hypothetical protein
MKIDGNGYANINFEAAGNLELGDFMVTVTTPGHQK